MLIIVRVSASFWIDVSRCSKCPKCCSKWALNLRHSTKSIHTEGYRKKCFCDCAAASEILLLSRLQRFISPSNRFVLIKKKIRHCQQSATKLSRRKRRWCIRLFRYTMCEFWRSVTTGTTACAMCIKTWMSRQQHYLIIINRQFYCRSTAFFLHSYKYNRKYTQRNGCNFQWVDRTKCALAKFVYKHLCCTRAKWPAIVFFPRWNVLFFAFFSCQFYWLLIQVWCRYSLDHSRCSKKA